MKEHQVWKQGYVLGCDCERKKRRFRPTVFYFVYKIVRILIMILPKMCPQKMNILKAFPVSYVLLRRQANSRKTSLL
ncbi:hypothetical protein HanHA300_Chr05g0179151 [Helianthus annuus]|nr:hypothetical protein HanHA300_Chr05g0179151 [Helianthus annuus]KAJ0584884.1 hypothetical protein HanHA89_Chr05g0193891 [Helianthus annuus]